MIEKTFVDRVPTNPGRVRITPVAGEENTFDVERADNPRVEGTLLNKSAFDSIVHSRLTGRYYLPTVTREVVSSTISSTNPIPKSGWTNVSTTGAQSGNYIVTASGSRSQTFTPDKAFDGDSTSSWQEEDNITGEMWVAVNFGTPIVITDLRCYWWSRDGDDFSIRFQGSNNGTIWEDVASRKGSMTAAEDWSFANTTQYSHYRLLFRQGTVDPMRLYEWSVTGWSTGTYSNALKLGNEVPTVWHSGQRLMIETPSSLNTVGVTANTLNGVTVRTILQPSKRYELRYDGAAFVAKEA